MCIYFIVLFFFTRTYGGFKIGYLKTGEVMFAQIFANICANFVFYVELCLLKYGFPSPIYLAGLGRAAKEVIIGEVLGD